MPREIKFRDMTSGNRGGKKGWVYAAQSRECRTGDSTNHVPRFLFQEKFVYPRISGSCLKIRYTRVDSMLLNMPVNDAKVPIL